jgi:hypothetical protein
MELAVYNFLLSRACFFRYAGEGHLSKEWKETTREIPDVSTAAPRAATYVNKLKVLYCSSQFQ